MLISSSYHKDIRKINAGGANSDADIISGGMLCWLFFKSEDGRRAQFPTNYSFHVLHFMQFVWMYYGRPCGHEAKVVHPRKSCFEGHQKVYVEN